MLTKVIGNAEWTAYQGTFSPFTFPDGGVYLGAAVLTPISGLTSPSDWASVAVNIGTGPNAIPVGFWQFSPANGWTGGTQLQRALAASEVVGKTLEYTVSSSDHSAQVQVDVSIGRVKEEG